MIYSQKLHQDMHEKFEYTCKNCKKIFHTEAVRNLKIQQDEMGISEEIDLLEHLDYNSFTKIIDTENGQATLNIQDLDLEVKCPKCKHVDSYLVSEIKLT